MCSALSRVEDGSIGMRVCILHTYVYHAYEVFKVEACSKERKSGQFLKFCVFKEHGNFIRAPFPIGIALDSLGVVPSLISELMGVAGSNFRPFSRVSTLFIIIRPKMRTYVLNLTLAPDTIGRKDPPALRSQATSCPRCGRSSLPPARASSRVRGRARRRCPRVH